MNRCPVCNELINNSTCFNCNYEIKNSIEGNESVIKDMIRSYRKEWLKTMREFEFESSYTKLIKYKGPSSNVVVPYGVEIIESAFSENQSVKNVVLPNTVTTIGHDAFSFCSKLESVHIPITTTHILKDAFWGCKNLRIDIPENVSVIEEGALTQVTNICVSDRNSHFTVHQNMLIDVRQGVLLAAAFESAGMEIVVPDGVKRIGAMAFNVIRNLPASLVLPKSLLSIGEGALVNISKQPVIIPKSVSKIENDAFAMLFDVELEAENPYYIQKDDVIIEVKTNTLVSVCNKKASIICIPAGIKAIANRAFMYCKNLTEITIPRSVESIGHYAFSCCESLANIVIPCSVVSMGHAVFDESVSLKTIFCEHDTIPHGWINTWSKGCRATIDTGNQYVSTNPSYPAISSVGKMNGHDFEFFCADVLRKNGFTDVKVTKGSGDQGVDILAKKDGIKYAIQCKNYASHLGNTPVQEVATGKIFYNCHVGVVMTNSTFTQGAKTLAQATGVLLWDKYVLAQMLEK